jgi:prephenate dehydrogenase
VLWQKVTIVGVGLMGGSLGLAIKRARLAARVEGCVRRAASVEECQRLGAVDRATLELASAVAGAELVVLCTPLGQMRDLTQRMLPALTPGVVVTDVGSVKGTVVRELTPLVAGAGGHFVGSHPMAGSEKTGVCHAQADLFEQAICVLTPTKATPRQALLTVEALWRGVGASIRTLSPEAHDQLVSRASHLPQILAAGLANYVLDPAHPRIQASLCAGGFRDTTRIASGSPQMWRDIALANRQHLGAALGELVAGLEKFRRALENADADAITEFLANAKQRRDAWCARGNCTLGASRERGWTQSLEAPGSPSPQPSPPVGERED